MRARRPRSREVADSLLHFFAAKLVRLLTPSDFDVRKRGESLLTSRTYRMNADAQQERFASWMRDHVAILYRVVNAFAAGDDRHDLMQEVMLALWRAAPAFLGQSQSSTFVYRVAHNAALTWRRTERKHQRHVAVAGDIDWMSRPEGGRSRSDTPARLETLYAAIRTLPPVDRSLILLSLDGLGYREIAEIHGLSESNVGARLTRTRQRLAELMKSQEHQDEYRPAQ